MHLVVSSAASDSSKESEIPENPSLAELSYGINSRSRELGKWKNEGSDVCCSLSDASAMVTVAACHVAAGRTRTAGTAIAHAIYELLDIAGQLGISVEAEIMEHHRLREGSTDIGNLLHVKCNK